MLSESCQLNARISVRKSFREELDSTMARNLQVGCRVKARVGPLEASTKKDGTPSARKKKKRKRELSGKQLVSMSFESFLRPLVLNKC